MLFPGMLCHGIPLILPLGEHNLTVIYECCCRANSSYQLMFSVKDYVKFVSEMWFRSLFLPCNVLIPPRLNLFSSRSIDCGMTWLGMDKDCILIYTLPDFQTLPPNWRCSPSQMTIFHKFRQSFTKYPYHRPVWNFIRKTQELPEWYPVILPVSHVQDQKPMQLLPNKHFEHNDFIQIRTNSL